MTDHIYNSAIPVFHDGDHAVGGFNGLRHTGERLRQLLKFLNGNELQIRLLQILQQLGIVFVSGIQGDARLEYSR